MSSLEIEGVFNRGLSPEEVIRIMMEGGKTEEQETEELKKNPIKNHFGINFLKSLSIENVLLFICCHFDPLDTDSPLCNLEHREICRLHYFCPV